jgi:hypothetical protein
MLVDSSATIRTLTSREISIRKGTEQWRTMTRYYAGIGSRDTPQEICQLMTSVAQRLEARGLHLRSGGAASADAAFAAGASPGARTLYVPWRGFNGLPDHEVVLAPSLPNWEDALMVAEDAHPAWEKCTAGARKLLARNTYQILGEDLNTPVEFIICWTKNGRGGGGTGQALRVAGMLPDPPPVYDLGDPKTLMAFSRDWLPA